jgi:long-subunit acyl-CoA synthetase (AMP-forming)
MIAHINVIANMMQIRWHDSVGRKAKGGPIQITLGLLPLSHIYGLVVIALSSVYNGDGVIILPKYEIKSLLETIQKFKINFLYLVRISTFLIAGIMCD